MVRAMFADGNSLYLCLFEDDYQAGDALSVEDCDLARLGYQQKHVLNLERTGTDNTSFILSRC